YPRRRENSKFSVFSFEFKRRGKGGGGAKFKIVGAPTFLLRVWRPGQHRMVDRNTSISILIYPRKTPRSPSGGLEHRSGICAHFLARSGWTSGTRSLQLSKARPILPPSPSKALAGPTCLRLWLRTMAMRGGLSIRCVFRAP